MTRRTTLARAAASLLLLLAGPMGPTAAVAGTRSQTEGVDAQVVGRVVGRDGAPAEGVTVTIVETDTGTNLFGGNGTRRVGTTTTGPDGRYSGVLPRAYVAGYETDYDWIVTASRPAGPGELEGVSSSFEFEANTAVQEAPDLPLWESTPVVSVDGYRAEVTIPVAQPPGMQIPLVSLNSRSKDGTAATFDLRAAEPEPDNSHESPRSVVRGAAGADATVRHSEGRTIYHQRTRTPTVTVDADLPLVPVSRGAPCLVTLTDGRVATIDRCGATDGSYGNEVTPRDLGVEAPIHAPDEPPPTTPGIASITVELPVGTAVGSVSVRGCDLTCVVEISSDGSTWVSPRHAAVESLLIYAYASNVDRVVIASFEPVGDGRLVRVGGGDQPLHAYEISVWPPAPGPDPGPPPSPGPPSPGPPAPSGTAAPFPAIGSPPAGRPVGPPLVAAVLVGSVGAGIAVEAVRRRRRFENELSSAWR